LPKGKFQLNQLIESIEKFNEVGYIYSRHFSNIDDIERLRRLIGTSTNLKCMVFDGERRPGSICLAQAVLCGIKHNTSIKQLSLYSWDLSQGPGYDFLNTLSSESSKLLTLVVEECDIGNGSEGLRAIASIATRYKKLKSLFLRSTAIFIGHEGEWLRPLVSTMTRNLRHLSFKQAGINDENLVDIVATIRGNRRLRLRVLDLEGNREIGQRGCDSIASLLESSSQSNLVGIDLSRVDLDNSCVASLAHGLRNKPKLRGLYLDDNPNISTDGFDALSRVLCNRRSINDTFLSNHTLKIINGPRPRIDPTNEFRGLLELNHVKDKRMVAMKKVTQYHSHFDMEPLFEWDLKVLPVAICWFDGAQACLVTDISTTSRPKFYSIQW